MQTFISHNEANKADARLLATALVEQGVGVWLDEWEVRPGDSITAGIESGLDKADVFILFWSAAAASSNWVGTELRAYIRRRVDNQELRIVPILCDTTPLPRLVADYRGFHISDAKDFQTIAKYIAGNKADKDIALMLQHRLWELAQDKIPDGSPHKYVVCPQCGSSDIEHGAHFDGYKERMAYWVWCLKCKFQVAQFADK